jgi:hypothetical protein
MSINSSGNLGLGTTPNAWLSSVTALQVKSAALYSAGNELYLSANEFTNASATNIYKNSGFATLYAQNSGQHRWYNASSGTAGNAISFTQAMTLDASGRLLVGTTSGSGATMFTVNQPAASTDAKTIVSVATGTNAAFTAFVNTTVTTVGTENSSGGSLVSGSSAYSTVIANNGAYPISFGTNNTERARITSAGDFLVSSGQTNLVGGLSVGTSSLQGSVIYFGSSVIAAGAGTYPLKWNSSTGVVTYDTSSRLVKENIEDSPYGLSEVLQLKSRKYHRTDDKRNEIGLVADEVQAVMPEFVPLVAKSIFTKDESDTELIAGGVNYDKLTSVLIKAIQEQQAIIESLKARLDAANL